ncbi:hypothetical protein V8F06_014969, partial [Rhypophila decipiens]
KLRRDDIGIFHPQWDDPDSIGLVADKKSIIFTDVNDFSTRLESLREGDSATEDHLLKLWPTLLAGPALLWWNSHITRFERNTLREAGLTALLDALKGRFEPDAVDATIKFTSDKLVLKDIAANEYALSQFFNTKLRHARTMGVLNDDNANWHGVMVQIWTTLDLATKQYLRPPSRRERLGEYMSEIDNARPILMAAARQRY